jgi:hypothetical protein
VTVEVFAAVADGGEVMAGTRVVVAARVVPDGALSPMVSFDVPSLTSAAHLAAPTAATMSEAATAVTACLRWDGGGSNGAACTARCPTGSASASAPARASRAAPRAGSSSEIIDPPTASRDGPPTCFAP